MTARILIIEDEEPLTLLLRYNLEAEGYSVDSAMRGDDADLKLKENQAKLEQIKLQNAPLKIAMELAPTAETIVPAKPWMTAPPRITTF